MNTKIHRIKHNTAKENHETLGDDQENLSFIEKFNEAIANYEQEGFDLVESEINEYQIKDHYRIRAFMVFKKID